MAVNAGAGYNLALAGDASDAPIREGAFIQYGARYDYLFSDSFGIGASLVMQHEMLNPSRLALLPGLEFVCSF